MIHPGSLQGLSLSFTLSPSRKMSDTILYPFDWKLPSGIILRPPPITSLISSAAPSQCCHHSHPSRSLVYHIIFTPHASRKKVEVSKKNNSEIVAFIFKVHSHMTKVKIPINVNIACTALALNHTSAVAPSIKTCAVARFNRRPPYTVNAVKPRGEAEGPAITLSPHGFF
mmetsp:Transcript_59254/g.125965  ORF Transcript_59254/g.125965 Transcript_59254/m.125965 type:complete len:170 (+) Transcript_59254:200-709(+)